MRDVFAHQDIAPTVLALEGLALPQTLDGRVLSEAFRKISKPPVKVSSRHFQVTTGDFCAESSKYLNEARRCETRQ